MIVTIPGYGSFQAQPVDIVRLVASSMGIIDLDLEPYPEKVTLKTGGDTYSGKTMNEVCVKFLDKVLKK